MRVYKIIYAKIGSRYYQVPFEFLRKGVIFRQSGDPTLYRCQTNIKILPKETGNKTIKCVYIGRKQYGRRK